jgi:hypothetical protein
MGPQYAVLALKVTAHNGEIAALSKTVMTSLKRQEPIIVYHRADILVGAYS